MAGKESDPLEPGSEAQLKRLRLPARTRAASPQVSTAVSRGPGEEEGEVGQRGRGAGRGQQCYHAQDGGRMWPQQFRTLSGPFFQLEISVALPSPTKILLPTPPYPQHTNFTLHNQQIPERMPGNWVFGKSYPVLNA